VPSHALAWALGMLVAFAGTAVIDERTPPGMVAAVGAAIGLAMGALVAAVTGLALVRLLVAVARQPGSPAGVASTYPLSRPCA
jgi:hypothetical protein